MRRYIFTTLFAIFAIVACMPEQSADKRFDEGVSKELAEWRKATISDVEYDLVFDLVENSGVVRISFALAEPQDVVIDFRNTELVADIFVPGEGLPIEAALHNEHIIIPSYQTKAGKNSVEVLFRLDNQSLNRRDDFLYTLLVPDRARTLFPCFDQPDIKATYRLMLTVPKSWVAVSNTAIEGVEELDDKKTITFAPTEPLSTYLFSFVAGEFEQRTYDDGVHRFTAYYRESDPKRLAQLPQSSSRWHRRLSGWRSLRVSTTPLPSTTL